LNNFLLEVRTIVLYFCADLNTESHEIYNSTAIEEQDLSSTLIILWTEFMIDQNL